MPRVTTPYPQPHEQRHRQLNECTQQPWLRLAWFAHPAFGAMHLERPDGWRRPWRTKNRSLEHIPGPVVTDGQPQRIGVQSQQHERGATRQHAEQLLGIAAVIARKAWNEHR